VLGKIVFTGCSFTAGDGWGLDHNHTAKELWVNLCHNNIAQLTPLDLINGGVSGFSNSEIFDRTIKLIGDHGDKIKFLFCQWTAMPRYNFSAGLELWTTKVWLDNTGGRQNFNINLSNGKSWDREYLNDLLDRLLVLHHLHGEIVKVVSYTNTISNICEQLGIAVYFINGLCPWDTDYFVPLTNNSILPENYTPFTKKEILNIEDRDDNDIFKLYNLIHNEYKQLGGIQEQKWLNLYNSLKSQQIDVNYDNAHPGIKSNQLYYKQLNQALQSKIGNYTMEAAINSTKTLQS
jgi:hypothetical protein